MNTLGSALALGFAPPDRRPISEWSREFVRLPAGAVFDPPGPFIAEASPYLLEPLRAIADDLIRFICIQAGVQTGKSLIGDVAAYHTICNRPQNMFVNLPTEKQADNWAKRRLMKLFHAPGPVADLIQEVKTLKRHDVCIHQIIFPNMWIAIQAANETNLQGFPVPFIINEELWEWAPGMRQHAIARTDHFEWRSKILEISQAGEKGSDMDQSFQAGTMEDWCVPCLHCDQYHSLPWSARLGEENGKIIYAGVTWDTNETTRPNGVWNFDALKPTCRFVCPHCRSVLPDDPALRRKANALGRYRVGNSNAPRNRRSFHWPSWASERVSFAAVVEEYLRAKDQERLGNRTNIREWYQKRAALSYDPEAHRTFDLAPTVDLRSATGPSVAESAAVPKFWDKQDFIFLAADVQRDHFWAIVEAWSKDGESMVLWAGKLLGWQDIADLQARFHIPHRCVLVDARHKPHQVYKECVLNGTLENFNGRQAWSCWIAAMGDPRRHFVYVNRSKRRVDLPYQYPPQRVDPCLGLHSDDPDLPRLRGRTCTLLYFAKGWIDPLSFDRRDLLMAGNIAHLAKGDWNEEFTKQLFGEMPETIVSPLGHRVSKARCIGPNHLLDCWRMSLVAACLAQILGAKRPE